MNKTTKITAAALLASICLAAPARAETEAIIPLTSETIKEVQSPATLYVGFGGPGMDPALKAAPEGTVELVSGPAVPVQEPAVFGTGMAYTEKDLYILAHVICGEAQSYPDAEQRYVGSVVLNRMNSGRYPGTIEGVVFQSGQYSCTRDGNYYRTPTAANWANAKWLLENGSILPSNVVYQSGGRQGRGVYLRTSHHTYCY